MTADSPAITDARDAVVKADQATERAEHPVARELFEQAGGLLSKAIRLERGGDRDV